MQDSFYILSYLNCNRDDTYCWPAFPCWHSGHSPDWAVCHSRGGPEQWLCRSCGQHHCPRLAHLWRSPSPDARPWAWLCSVCRSVRLTGAWSAVLTDLDLDPPPGPGHGIVGSSTSPFPVGTWTLSPQNHPTLWGSKKHNKAKAVSFVTMKTLSSLIPRYNCTDPGSAPTSSMKTRPKSSSERRQRPSSMSCEIIIPMKLQWGLDMPQKKIIILIWHH